MLYHAAENCNCLFHQCEVLDVSALAWFQDSSKGAKAHRPARARDMQAMFSGQPRYDDFWLLVLLVTLFCLMNILLARLLLLRFIRGLPTFLPGQDNVRHGFRILSARAGLLAHCYG